MIPEAMPVISSGGHDDPSQGACVMEYVSLLAGEDWSDRPSCTDPVLAEAARVINDRCDDYQRHRLVPMIGRLMGTGGQPLEVSMEVLLRMIERAAIEEFETAMMGTSIGTLRDWVEHSPSQRAAERSTLLRRHGYAHQQFGSWRQRGETQVSQIWLALAYAYSAALDDTADAGSWLENGMYHLAGPLEPNDFEFLEAALDAFDEVTGRTEVPVVPVERVLEVAAQHSVGVG